VIDAWFAILITGRYPRGAFDFVEGVFAVAEPRRRIRDRFADGPVHPPFRLAHDGSVASAYNVLVIP
jgi:hypothetical protein